MKKFIVISLVAISMQGVLVANSTFVNETKYPVKITLWGNGALLPEQKINAGKTGTFPQDGLGASAVVYKNQPGTPNPTFEKVFDQSQRGPIWATFKEKADGSFEFVGSQAKFVNATKTKLPVKIKISGWMCNQEVTLAADETKTIDLPIVCGGSIGAGLQGGVGLGAPFDVGPYTWKINDEEIVKQSPMVAGILETTEDLRAKALDQLNSLKSGAKGAQDKAIAALRELFNQ